MGVRAWVNDGEAPALSLKMVAVAMAAAVVTMGAVALAGGTSSGGEDVTSVVQHPDRFVGERATVTGRVGKVLSATSCTLTEDGMELLVLDVSTMAAIDDDLDGVVADEQVHVTGVVRRFTTIEEMERHVGEVPDARYEPFLGKPVLMAESVSPV